MKLRKFIIGVGAVCAVTFLTVGFALAAGANFSADMISHMGNQNTTAKIYVSGDKTRLEMEGNIVITRLDKNVSWVIMPAEKMYMEHPIMKAKQPQTTKEMPGEVSRESLGKETVDGQETEKFKVTYTEDGKTQVVHQWLKDGVLPVKIEAVDGSWGMEYKNISIAAIAEDLFEVPQDYTKFAMPDMGGMGGMMKGMMPGGK